MDSMAFKGSSNRFESIFYPFVFFGRKNLTAFFDFDFDSEMKMFEFETNVIYIF